MPMGRRSSTETVTAILLAFLERRSWSQKALADHCGVSVKTVKRHLTDLSAAGFPLYQDRDPPHVYWSVPKDWFPGAVAFRDELLTVLVRVLRNSPHSDTRSRLLTHVAAGATGMRLAATPEAVVTSVLSREQEAILWEIEDSIERRVPVHMRYYTMSRGDAAWRHASVHRVVLKDAIRMIATCHRDGKLKWFRLDNVWWARADESERFRHRAPEEIAAFTTESVDGFHSGDAAQECRFTVRLPEARWVKAQLTAPVAIDEGPAEYEFAVQTAGMLPLARFVVGLGEAARCETPELRAVVEELARGAMGAE